MKKLHTSLLLVVALSFGSFFSNASVAATPSTKELQKQIATLKAQVAAKDKEIKTLKEQTKPLTTSISYQENVMSGNYNTGSSTVPTVLSYKGVQYMPISAIGSLFNLPLKYDSKLDTTFIGENASGLIMSDILSPYYSDAYVKVNKDLVTGGITYKKGFNFTFYDNDDSVNFNLAGKYTTISGTLGLEDFSSGSSIINFYGDGRLLKSVELELGDLPTNDVSFSVKGVKKLEIKSTLTGGYSSKVLFVNPKIN